MHCAKRADFLVLDLEHHVEVVRKGILEKPSKVFRIERVRVPTKPAPREGRAVVDDRQTVGRFLRHRGGGERLRKRFAMIEEAVVIHIQYDGPSGLSGDSKAIGQRVASVIVFDHQPPPKGSGKTPNGIHESLHAGLAISVDAADMDRDLRRFVEFHQIKDVAMVLEVADGVRNDSRLLGVQQRVLSRMHVDADLVLANEGADPPEFVDVAITPRGLCLQMRGKGYEVRRDPKEEDSMLNVELQHGLQTRQVAPYGLIEALKRVALQAERLRAGTAEGPVDTGVANLHWVPG